MAEQIDVNGLNAASAAIGALTGKLQTLSACAAAEFGAVTKSVNLLGANVVNRLAGCAEAVKSLGAGFREAGSGMESAGGGIASGIMQTCAALDGVTGYVPQIALFAGALAGLGRIGGGLNEVGAAILNIGTGMLGMANSLTLTADGLNLLAVALPLVGAGFMNMLISLGPVLEYVPQLLIFTGAMTVFSLLGEGLAAAGAGLVGIAQGFALMGEALPAVNDAMFLLIENLMNTQVNLGGILTLVLLSAAMFVMALAVESLNKHLAPMVETMGKLQDIFSVGLVLSIGIFAAMMLLLSLTMGKVASGVDKVTAALKKQCAQFAVLVPLQTMSTILSNPVVGTVTVALATAAGLVMTALMPKLAAGGVARDATVAVIGEGSYPEAVVPLGSSPQFMQMKNDIANAVLRGIAALGGGAQTTAPMEVTITVDGEKLARTVIPAIDRENRRKGFVAQLRSV